MARPPLRALAEEAYEALGPWARADEGTWDLLSYVASLVDSLAEIDELVRDTDEFIGWGRLLDVDATPGYALPWLAQFVGVTPLRGLSEDAQRTRIKEAAGFSRGTPAAIRAAARQFLTGLKQVDVFERDGSPWRFRIRTYRVETPNPQAVRDAVIALKPAGLVFVHEVQAGITIDETLGTINGYAQTIASFSDTVPTNPPAFGIPFGAGKFGRGFYGGTPHA